MSGEGPSTSWDALEGSWEAPGSPVGDFLASGKALGKQWVPWKGPGGVLEGSQGVLGRPWGCLGRSGEAPWVA